MNKLKRSPVKWYEVPFRAVGALLVLALALMVLVWAIGGSVAFIAAVLEGFFG